MAAIDVFHALVAGNGRLIDASTPVDVDCFRVVAVLVPDAPAAVTWAWEMDGDADVDVDVADVAADTVGCVDVESDAEPSTDGDSGDATVAGPFALCVPPCVQPLSTTASASITAPRTYSRERRTWAG